MYRLGRIEVSRIRESGTWAACNPRDQVRRYNRLWRRIRFGQFLAGLRRHFVAGNQLLRNKTAVDRGTMKRFVSLDALKSPQPEVHITVDKFANYEVVAQTLADIQHRGLKKIAFVNNDFF
jgi:hypothetical protein